MMLESSVKSALFRLKDGLARKDGEELFGNIRNKDRKMIAFMMVIDHFPRYFRRYVCRGKREVLVCKCVVSGIVLSLRSI